MRSTSTSSTSRAIFSKPLILLLESAPVDNSRIDRQELTGICANQHYETLASQSIEITRQQRVLSFGIAAQQELITAASRIMDSFLSQLIATGITKLLTEPIPYDRRGISKPD